MSSIETTFDLSTTVDLVKPCNRVKAGHTHDKQICTICSCCPLFFGHVRPRMLLWNFCRTGQNWKTVKLTRYKLNQADNARDMMMAMQCVKHVEFR
jgi:hypothetical protein